jgi:hypothetical protein
MMESEVIGYLSEVGGTWGPWILMAMLMASGAGIPLGEDIFIIPAGILVAQGLFPFWETLIAAYLGVKDIKDLQITLAVTLAVAGGITAIIFFFRRRGLTRNLPRAKAAWLRGVCGTPAGAAS